MSKHVWFCLVYTELQNKPEFSGKSPEVSQYGSYDPPSWWQGTSALRWHSANLTSNIHGAT